MIGNFDGTLCSKDGMHRSVRSSSAELHARAMEVERLLSAKSAHRDAPAHRMADEGTALHTQRADEGVEVGGLRVEAIVVMSLQACRDRLQV